MAAFEAAAAPALQPPGRALAALAPPRHLVALAPPRAHAFARYGFRIGDLGLLVPEGHDAETAEPTGVAPIPRAPVWLVGVMNRRGRPVPLFDLRGALGLPERAADAQATVIVIGKGADAFALAADGLPVALRDLAGTALPDALPAALAPFVARAWTGGGALWLDADPAALIAALNGQPDPRWS